MGVHLSGEREREGERKRERGREGGRHTHGEQLHTRAVTVNRKPKHSHFN